MMKLQDEGKLRYIGVSNYTTALLEGCRQAAPRPVAAAALLARSGATTAAAELPWCQAHGSGVIVYSPMQSGLLTDGFTAARVAAMPEDDWRRRAPYFQEPNLGRNLALRDALRPMAQKHGVNVGAMAVAWALAWPGDHRRDRRARAAPSRWTAGSARPGFRSTRRSSREIASAIERTGAGSGPLRPA